MKCLQTHHTILANTPQVDSCLKSDLWGLLQAQAKFYVWNVTNKLSWWRELRSHLVWVVLVTIKLDSIDAAIMYRLQHSKPSYIVLLRRICTAS